MNIKCLFFSLLIVGLASCGSGDAVNTTPEGLRTFDRSFMNTALDPAEDFFLYCNGSWVKNNPIPINQNSWSSFNELQDYNNSILKKILERASENGGEKGSVTQLIGDYYKTFIDIEKRDADGIAPIQEQLDKIEAVSNKADLVNVMADHHNYAINSFFSFNIEQDFKDNTKYAIFLCQGGIALPGREYYLDADKTELRKEYKVHVTQMFQLIGWDKATAQAGAAAILKIETALAKVSMGIEQLRKIKTQYNPMLMADAMQLYPSFNWNMYFEKRGVSMPETIIVTQPDFLRELENIMQNTSLEDLKAYYTWTLLDQSASSLTSTIDQQNFRFYWQIMRGIHSMRPHWERGLNYMHFSALGEALGHAYVDETFSAESKAKANIMVDNIIATFKERLDANEWMSDSTKVMAHIKLASFGRKLGYPDEWTDYSSLDINRESYYANYLAARAFDVRKRLDKLNGPINKNEWDMPSHTVNAYYNPLRNEIVFPAGILQPPFFDPEAEDALNYGRMGMVIGHELIHGFDDQGKQFDAVGELKNWWTQKDQVEFQERTEKLVNHCDNYLVLDTVHLRGELTLGENIADLGGLTLAYYAYLKSLEGKEKKIVNGYTPEQRYFICFAQLWKVNLTNEALIQQVKTNPHAPGMYRVNGPLSNMPEFFQAFNIPEDSPMRNSAENIADIW